MTHVSEIIAFRYLIVSSHSWSYLFFLIKMTEVLSIFFFFFLVIKNVLDGLYKDIPNLISGRKLQAVGSYYWGNVKL